MSASGSSVLTSAVDPAHPHRLKKLRSGTPPIRPVRTTDKDVFAFGTGTPLIVGPKTEPTGIVFEDRSFLTVYEKWSKRANKLLAYSYHYQVPGGLSIRYDMDVSVPIHQILSRR